MNPPMPRLRLLAALTGAALVGCSRTYLAPPVARLDLPQAARLSTDHTQAAASVSLLNLGLSARRTLGMGGDVRGDLGVQTSLFSTSADGGLWLQTPRSAIRLGLTGGVGEDTWWSESAGDRHPGGFGAPAFGGATVHIQHVLGKARLAERKTAWTLTQGYGFGMYVGAPASVGTLPSANVDLSVRADLRHRAPHGWFFLLGLGTNWILPNGAVRVGYRF